MFDKDGILGVVRHLRAQAQYAKAALTVARANGLSDQYLSILDKQSELVEEAASLLEKMVPGEGELAAIILKRGDSHLAYVKGELVAAALTLEGCLRDWMNASQSLKS